MKRGVFMLILKFCEERECVKKRNKRFRNKIKNNNFVRYSINVNGKTAVVLELKRKDLINEDVLKLLNVYKGKVLVPEINNAESLLEEYIFNPKEYYQRALLSSFVKQMKSGNNDWKYICIKTNVFSPFKELYELVKVFKTVCIITAENALTHNFSKRCYYEYGAIVSVKEDIFKDSFDVFIDLDLIDDRKLMINVKGKACLLYPDAGFFEEYAEYKKVEAYNIEHNLICAAFSNK